MGETASGGTLGAGDGVRKKCDCKLDCEEMKAGFLRELGGVGVTPSVGENQEGGLGEGEHTPDGTLDGVGEGGIVSMNLFEGGLDIRAKGAGKVSQVHLLILNFSSKLLGRCLGLVRSRSCLGHSSEDVNVVPLI